MFNQTVKSRLVFCFLMDITTLLILTLATFRLTSLLVSEDGPFDIFARLRARAGVRVNEYGLTYSESFPGQILMCSWCASVWIGAVIALAWYFAPGITFWIDLALALSAGAIIIESVTNGES